MRGSSVIVAAGLVFALALTLHAGPDRETGEATSLDASLAARLEAALASGVGAPADEALERAAVLAHGSVDPLLVRLREIERDTDRPQADRDAAAWLRAAFLRRRGDLREALRVLRPVSERDDRVAVLLRRARLEDATGRFRDALATYATALPKVEDPAVAIDIRLRMALLGGRGDGELETSLAAFAAEPRHDASLRNRAAAVLALEGHPAKALDLFVASGDGAPRVRQELRLAAWALAADDAPRAQGHAWRAVETATLERDRRYALAVLVEAHRHDDTLPALIERFSTQPDLSEAARNTWIDLLRETGRVEEALRLFRGAAQGQFTASMRRELLEMCRESGQEDVLLEAYRELIGEEPAVIEWREGLSRHYLERGDTDAARAVWTSYVEDASLTPYLLTAAETLRGLGLDDLAMAFAEAAIERGQAPYAGLLFLFELHRSRGRMATAEVALERMDGLADARAPERMQMAEAYERIGKKARAVAVLEALRAARGPKDAGEDLEMRLAWLHSEVGNEELALARWRELWLRVESVPRRRYVEDRMMTVAARLGKLADIAIELEERLAAGTADARDSGLLVRLYTKANDPVSATEVIEEYMKYTGGNPVKALVEKARVFLACTDYHNYEKTIRTLIEEDPEGEGDYLRQLAMSQLERGHPEEAREVLTRLRTIETGSDSAEFEAGVLALAGLREDAIVAYRKGLAADPDRIESYLLMGNVMRELGLGERAIGMYQHLAETAEKDDLFTVAIDGLLNLEAPPPVLQWARRATLERLARRHDKMYLYQLISDLSEELGEQAGMLRALESALPIAGSRRSSLLRELMDLSRGPRGDPKKHLAYGRRLIGLGEVAPPQVYLDLGEAFLRAGEVRNASKTFGLATELPDYNAFQSLVASSFERAGYPGEALRAYERLLISQAGDVRLLAKVGELHEQLGRDDLARELYLKALELVVARRPLSTVIKEDEDPDDPWRFWRARNVDDFDQYYDRVLQGVLTTVDDEADATALLETHRVALEADLQRAVDAMKGADEADAKKMTKVRNFPRVLARAQLYRRVAMVYGQPQRADELDRKLLAAFPEDETLLETLCKARIARGLVTSARSLIATSGRSEAEQRRLQLLAGGGGAEATGLVPIGEATRLFLPLLIAGKTDAARLVFGRLDLSRVEKQDLEQMPILFSAAVLLDDGGLALALGRHWFKALVKHDKSPSASYRLLPVLQRLERQLDAEEYRSLCEYVVSVVLENPESTATWMNLLPTLQKSFEEPLIDEEQLQELLEKLDGNRWYWLGSFFSLVKEEGRSAALRTILPKVPNSRQMQFLLQLIDQIKEPIEGDFADFLAESFEAALENVDRADTYGFYGFLNLARNDVNLELKLRIVDLTIAKAFKSGLLRAAKAVLLKKAGKGEEALKLALDAYEPLMTSGPQQHYENMARNLIHEAFLPEHLDAFVAFLDERQGKGAESLSITNRRLELIQRNGGAPAMLAALRAAVAAHPEDYALLSRLQSQLARMGFAHESMQLLERMQADRPADASLRARVVSGWRRMRHPLRALAARDASEAPAAEAEEEPVAKRPLYVSMRDVKKALDEGDVAQARTAFRRVWRNFRVDQPGRMVMIRQSFHPARFHWPAEPGEPDEERLRGGLASFTDEEVETPEPVSAYEVLAEHPWGEAELRRQLRTWTGNQLSNAGPLVDGVANARVRRLGRAEATQQLLAAVRDGKAGKLEYGLLLTLLESDSAVERESVEAILDDLAQTLDPTDVGQLRRLARIWARIGEPDRAGRLYRWCGTRTNANQFVVFGAGGPQPIPANELVQEVGAELEGERRDETIEAILALADPGVDRRFGPQARDPYETLVIDTWERLLGPALALERCRALCEDIKNVETSVRRQAAKRAATLFARAGEIESAIACLEVALCTLEPPADAPPHWSHYYKQTGYIGYADIRRLFPADTTGWKDATAWLRAAARAMDAWRVADRMNADRAFSAFAVLTLRLARAGATDDARALLGTLKTLAGDHAQHLLWVIDLARELGDEREAHAIERTLLEERRLNVHRVADVVRRIRAKDGAETALLAGEAAAEYTLHPELLAELVATARAAEKPERVAHWEETAAQAEAATQRLEEK